VGDGAGVLVGPDNGLLAPAVAMAGGAGRAVALTNPDYQLPAPGATFAGRDIFAPAAAHLCNGVDLYQLGDELDAASLLPGVVPLARPEGAGLAAEVLWVDHYGNAQLNVGPDDIAGWGDQVRLRFGDATRGAVVRPAFGALAPGQLGLVVDSYGLLAICLDRRSAAGELGLPTGTAVLLEPYPDEDREADGADRPPSAPVRMGPRR
jgi:S-adenosyl-L-methionine hydrolase (adenosine-forming)